MIHVAWLQPARVVRWWWELVSGKILWLPINSHCGGRRHWEDAHSRRFRYLLVVGAEPYSRMELEEPEPGLARDPEALANQTGGVFGLEPPRTYSKVEEDVWKRLGAQSGLTGSNASTSSSTPDANL